MSQDFRYSQNAPSRSGSRANFDPLATGKLIRLEANQAESMRFDLVRALKNAG